MTEEPDLFAWAESAEKPTAVIIDALPRILQRIRLEQAYKIPRPTGGAVVIQMQRKAA